MTTKQANRYFHRNARVRAIRHSTGERWTISYCGGLWYALTESTLRKHFLADHDGRRAGHESSLQFALWRHGLKPA